MTSTANKICKQALRLAPVDRAELIEALFHSFDQKRRNQIDVLWMEEAESRIDGYDAGKIKDDSVESVLARINER